MNKMETKKQDNQLVGSLWDSVAQSLGFPNEHQKFWWRATAPSLGHLLASCQYSEEDQLAHLRWYHRFIIPALVQRPIPGQKAQFEPCPVFDGSVCEHSVNWRELDRARTVRFTIEATGFQAGTATDPFNQDESKHLLRNMAREVRDLDLKQFELFVNEFFLPSDTAETLMPQLPAGTPLSQVWIAFDLLRGGKLMAKVYFMPILKWIHAGAATTKTLVFDAVRKHNGEYGTYDGSIALLNSYLESFASGEKPVVEMVAIDCLDSPHARIKIYLRTGVNTLTKAKQTYCLGGRLSGEVIEAGLEALAELWPILFRLPADDNIENTEVFPRGSYCGCAVEMRPGHAEPETKIHIPVRKIQGTDAQLCESLSTWFKGRGHGDFAAAYKKDLMAALYVLHNILFVL
jgi:DMATS type aromatic prenyltransferase